MVGISECFLVFPQGAAVSGLQRAQLEDAGLQKRAVRGAVEPRIRTAHSVPQRGELARGLQPLLTRKARFSAFVQIHYTASVKRSAAIVCAEPRLIQIFQGI